MPEPGTATVQKATAGTFANPLNSSEALEVWGTASITVLNCNEIRIVIDGKDGAKTSNTVRMAGIISLDCSGS